MLRFLFHPGLTPAWTTALALGLRRFGIFAVWLLSNLDCCRIMAHMTRKLRPGMVPDHCPVDFLSQSAPGKHRLRWNLSRTFPPTQPLQTLAIVQESNQGFRRRNIVHSLGHERPYNCQTIIPLDSNT